MSVSATTPSNDPNQGLLFGIDRRLFPAIATVLCLVVLVVVSLCTLSAIHRYRLARMMRDPATLAALRERQRLREEVQKVEPPKLDEAYVASDLESGILDSPFSKEWKPLSVEKVEPHEERAKSPVPTNKTPLSAADMGALRLAVIIVFPSQLRQDSEADKTRTEPIHKITEDAPEVAFGHLDCTLPIR